MAIGGASHIFHKRNCQVEIYQIWNCDFDMQVKYHFLLYECVIFTQIISIYVQFTKNVALCVISLPLSLSNFCISNTSPIYCYSLFMYAMGVWVPPPQSEARTHTLHGGVPWLESSYVVCVKQWQTLPDGARRFQISVQISSPYN